MDKKDNLILANLFMGVKCKAWIWL